MDRLTPLDAMALGWAVVVFLGLWLIWPALAVVAAGVGGLLLTIALFIGQRKSEVQ